MNKNCEEDGLDMDDVLRHYDNAGHDLFSLYGPKDGRSYYIRITHK